MKRLAVAAVAAMLFGAAPVAAQVSRAPTMSISAALFYNRCVNPQGYNHDAIVAACAMYVTGVADGLQSTGLACTGGRVAPGRLYGVSMWWIRNHWQYARYPAWAMVRNGFETVYPCRPSANAGSRGPTLEQIEKAVAFAETVRTVLSWLAAM